MFIGLLHLNYKKLENKHGPCLPLFCSCKAIHRVSQKEVADKYWLTDWLKGMEVRRDEKGYGTNTSMFMTRHL